MASISPVRRAQTDGSPDTTGSRSSSNDFSPQSVLTAFSPADVQLKSDISLTLGGKLEDSSNKDPFLSYSEKMKDQPKLSPMATVFQPIRPKSGLGMPVVADGSGSPVRVSPSRTKHMSLLEKLISPNNATSQESSTRVHAGVFSTSTSTTRCIKIMPAYIPLSIDDIHMNLDLAAKEVNIRGDYDTAFDQDSLFAKFTNLSDATNVTTKIQQSSELFAVEYVAPNVFVQAAAPGSLPVSAHEGQVVMTCTFMTSAPSDREGVEDCLQKLLTLEGTIIAHQRQLAVEANKFSVIVEFDDARIAPIAISRLDRVKIRDFEIRCSLHQPDLAERAAPILACGSLPVTPARQTHGVGGLVNSMSNISLISPYGPLLSPTGRSVLNTSPAPAMSPMYTNIAPKYGPSPVVSYEARLITPPRSFMSEWNGSTGSVSPVSQDFVSPQGRGVTRRQFTPRSKTYTPSTHHNTVDINRIRNGSDVRTTIMLRNIPNKVTQRMLKEIVDETSFGLYDFMYLRIDFANNCNVGYAFINFEDPYNIIEFVNARAGKKWNHFNSDKVAEVSYATIQGKDCLVQKFRNSSVMLEATDFRPKIFHTRGHPCAGTEDDFPGPDNPSKMRRSVENAEHVGLFAPRSGQHFHDDQRRRRSRFDRGTRFAEIEEGEYNDSMSPGFARSPSY